MGRGWEDNGEIMVADNAKIMEDNKDNGRYRGDNEKIIKDNGKMMEDNGQVM